MDKLPFSFNQFIIDHLSFHLFMWRARDSDQFNSHGNQIFTVSYSTWTFTLGMWIIDDDVLSVWITLWNFFKFIFAMRFFSYILHIPKIRNDKQSNERKNDEECIQMKTMSNEWKTKTWIKIKCAIKNCSMTNHQLVFNARQVSCLCGNDFEDNASECMSRKWISYTHFHYQIVYTHQHFVDIISFMMRALRFSIHSIEFTLQLAKINNSNERMENIYTQLYRLEWNLIE